jgi:predicted transcriptional regulator
MRIMQKDDAIGFRVPAALKRALEAAAESEHRSLGQLCTLALMQFLEARGEWPVDRPRAGGQVSSKRKRSRAK